MVAIHFVQNDENIQNLTHYSMYNNYLLIITTELLRKSLFFLQSVSIKIDFGQIANRRIPPQPLKNF